MYPKRGRKRRSYSIHQKHWRYLMYTMNSGGRKAHRRVTYDKKIHIWFIRRNLWSIIQLMQDEGRQVKKPIFRGARVRVHAEGGLFTETYGLYPHVSVYIYLYIYTPLVKWNVKLTGNYWINHALPPLPTRYRRYLSMYFGRSLSIYGQASVAIPVWCTCFIRSP
jgi:hypothetical protein